MLTLSNWLREIKHYLHSWRRQRERATSCLHVSQLVWYTGCAEQNMPTFPSHTDTERAVPSCPRMPGLAAPSWLVQISLHLSLHAWRTCHIFSIFLRKLGNHLSAFHFLSWRGTSLIWNHLVSGLCVLPWHPLVTHATTTVARRCPMNL